MSQKNYQLTTLKKQLAEPKPLALLVIELVALLGISQAELAQTAGISTAGISRLVNNKINPSTETIGKLHHAFVQEFGIPAELLSIAYLLQCRDFDPQASVPTQFSQIDAWLTTQPSDIQRNFWTIVNTFIQAVDNAAQNG